MHTYYMCLHTNLQGQCNCKVVGFFFGFFLGGGGCVCVCGVCLCGGISSKIYRTVSELLNHVNDNEFWL